MFHLKGGAAQRIFGNAFTPDGTGPVFKLAGRPPVREQKSRTAWLKSHAVLRQSIDFLMQPRPSRKSAFAHIRLYRIFAICPRVMGLFGLKLPSE